MNADALMILNGFFQLPNLEKLGVVNAINEYFDEVEKREATRGKYQDEFAALDVAGRPLACKCCGRSG